MKESVRVNNEDQPDEVAEKFVTAMRRLGLVVEDISSDWIEYEISTRYIKGMRVKTTQADSREEWTDEAIVKRKFGVMGEIIAVHDSHGLYYDVHHDDGTVGAYGHAELEVL